MSESLSRPLADRVANLDMPDFTPRDYEIPQSAKNGAIQALAEGKTHYTNRPGIVPLREWVAAEMNTLFGLSIDKDDVTITCGVEEAIFACVMVLAESNVYCPGDASQLHGAIQLKNVPLVYSLDDVTESSLIYLTGADAQETIDAVLDQANPETCWIVWDVSHAGSETNPAQDARWASRVVTVSDSEDVLAGWRIGWMAGSDMAGKLRAFKQSMTICSPSISQWAMNGLVRGE